jgi:hypothetical protein
VGVSAYQDSVQLGRNFKPHISTMNRLLLAAFLSLCLCRAQTRLEITRSCDYVGLRSDTPVFFFPPDSQVVAAVDKLANSVSGVENFSLEAANVARATAVVNGDTRVILYSQDHTNVDLGSAAAWHSLLELAHQIGHHVNRHTLSIDPSIRKAEELDADSFAGFVLGRLGISLPELKAAAGFDEAKVVNNSNYPTMEGRQRALIEGWRAEHERDDRGNEDFNIDSQTHNGVWPPPKASAWSDVPRDFLQKRQKEVKLLETAAVLEGALEKAGYSERSYYPIPQGFALVSRVEQIKTDGTPQPPSLRWSFKSPKNFSISSYLQALFQGQPGLYRSLLFIVTTNPVLQSSELATFKVSLDWAWSGGSRLPVSTGALPFTTEYRCTAFVYEFERASPESDAIVRVPGLLSGRMHLERSGLWQALGN